MSKKLVALVLLMLVASMSGGALAQSDGPQVAAENLNFPRGIAYDTDGNLYITEAGLGGSLPADGPFGPALWGATSRVLQINAAGESIVVFDGLPSLLAEPDFLGASAVFVGRLLWVVTGHQIPGVPLSAMALGIDRQTARIAQTADFYTFEHSENPDGNEMVSNPNDIARSADGTFYFVDASGNYVATFTPENGLQPFKVWTNNPVPTSVSVSLDGSIYVGFLTGFPFPAGGATIEQYNAEGELLNTFTGLTAVTDVLAASTGALYAVEFAAGFDPTTGWMPNSGRVVEVTADGLTVVAEGLNFPYALAEAPDGRLAVSVNSAYAEPGSGQVLFLSLP